MRYWSLADHCFWGHLYTFCSTLYKKLRILILLKTDPTTAVGILISFNKCLLDNLGIPQNDQIKLSLCGVAVVSLHRVQLAIGPALSSLSQICMFIHFTYLVILLVSEHGYCMWQLKCSFQLEGESHCFAVCTHKGFWVNGHKVTAINLVWTDVGCGLLSPSHHIQLSYRATINHPHFHS